MQVIDFTHKWNPLLSSRLNINKEHLSRQHTTLEIGVFEEHNVYHNTRAFTLKLLT